jgi:hypothetical protein
MKQYPNTTKVIRVFTGIAVVGGSFVVAGLALGVFSHVLNGGSAGVLIFGGLAATWAGLQGRYQGRKVLVDLLSQANGPHDHPGPNGEPKQNRQDAAQRSERRRRWLLLATCNTAAAIFVSLVVIGVLGPPWSVLIPMAMVVAAADSWYLAYRRGFAYGAGPIDSAR